MAAVLPPPSVGRFKMVMLGDASVGKTTLAMRFSGLHQSEKKIATASVANFEKLFITSNGAAIKLDIWDTAGNERFRAITPMYLRGARAAIVLYDILSRESFEQAKNVWIEEVRRSQEEGMVVAFVGNKLDKKRYRKVGREEAEQYAASEGFMFFEASARTAENVEAVFHAVAEELGTRKYDDSIEKPNIRLGGTRTYGGWMTCC
ncbi:ras-related protein Rab-5A-like [Ochlerotatus camptorhynchus]|uniref:ras-related protein Rab-5A-like n=1 Tax=Ochlerotatus camptorhynchus TaxID=644619 RepID=UPI0031DFCBBD